MNKDEVIKITQNEAIKAVKAVKAKKIHCFLGMIGADWDRKSIIDLIKKSERIAWADNIFKHNLAIINDGRLYNFDIKH